MDYVLVSIGTIPTYLDKTINTIFSVDKNSKIYLCTDQTVEFKNVKIINLNEIISSQTKKISDQNIYKGTIFESNPLWITSLLRIFYLRDFQRSLNKTSIVHFDNDILIYKSFDEIFDQFHSSKFCITPASKNRLIFGYSYIPNIDNFEKICDALEKLIDKGINENWEFNNFSPHNEMDLLGMIYNQNNALFHLLPTLPYYSNIIFDPLDYGRYIDGSHTKPKKFFSTRRELDFNQNIGVELYSKRIKTKFENYLPKVVWEKEEFTLSNLHIHSKRFEKFLPKNYKSFI